MKVIASMSDFVKSLPTWGRGLKHKGDRVHVGFCESLPTWGRGLKPPIWVEMRARPRSLPTWGRGLKQRTDTVLDIRNRRSLHGGVD